MVAQFDTWSIENASFEGCWGVFPHLDNNTFYLSNRNGVLYVVDELIGPRYDSLWLADATATEGESFPVDIHAYNSLPTKNIVLPLRWSGDNPLQLDSVTLTDRTQQFQSPELITSWPAGGQAVYRLRSLGASIQPGTGTVARACFSLPLVTSPTASTLDFQPLNNWSTQFAGDCGDVIPTSTGSTVTYERCCQRLRGDLNGDGSNGPDAVDLSLLVDFLFAGTSTSFCPSEADVDADGTAASPVDLSFISDYLFAGGPAPLDCP